MSAIPVIAIFDIGKTNKKLFLFDEDYRIVYEECTGFDETVDEDGDPCEDLQKLERFLSSSLQKVFRDGRFEVKAVNFSTYGASFVHIDEKGQPVTPLYNYLKNYPKPLLQQFYEAYGGEHTFSVATASPVLGHLNSGLQLYWLKHTKPQLYRRIAHSLHLPQYVSFLLTRHTYSELTSVGCHTNLWDFSKQAYHNWVWKERIIEKLAPIVPSSHTAYPAVRNGHYSVGVGLHDSSAALIPYLASFHEPFLLLSTGTWCISLNPFNQTLLTAEELAQDCLCYLTYEGKPVKASRLFAGNEHEQQTKRLAAHFDKPLAYYKAVRLCLDYLRPSSTETAQSAVAGEKIISLQESAFAHRDLATFASYEEAYHQLMADLVEQQVASTGLVLKGAPVKKLFVDGGFSNNSIYMYLLAEAFPELEVYAAKMAQASAMGAALAIHAAWNDKAIPEGIVETKRYLPENTLARRKAVTE
jgi:sugar (pentulose or hexulose) kinase